MRQRYTGTNVADEPAPTVKLTVPRFRCARYYQDTLNTAAGWKNSGQRNTSSLCLPECLNVFLCNVHPYLCYQIHPHTSIRIAKESLSTHYKNSARVPWQKTWFLISFFHLSKLPSVQYSTVQCPIRPCYDVIIHFFT